MWGLDSVTTTQKTLVLHVYSSNCPYNYAHLFVTRLLSGMLRTKKRPEFVFPDHQHEQNANPLQHCVELEMLSNAWWENLTDPKVGHVFLSVQSHPTRMGKLLWKEGKP